MKLQDYLRDAYYMARYWDQYGIQAADRIDELEFQVKALTVLCYEQCKDYGLNNTTNAQPAVAHNTGNAR